MPSPARRWTILVVLIAALPLALPAPAGAAGPVGKVATPGGHPSQGSVGSRPEISNLVHGELLAALQAVASQNQCMSYAYDHNGNILTKTDQAFSASPTWGSAAFGCFTWTAP